MIRKNWILLQALLACGALASYTFAGPISIGNLVVTRVGTGSAALAGSGTDTFLEEFTTSGAPVQTIALPTTVSGSGNRALRLTGTATSEGFLKLSTNHQYLTLAGYNAAAAGATATTFALGAPNRVVGRVEISSGNIDTTTALTESYDGSNIRSAFTTDGTDIWTGGNAGSGAGATAGVRYTTLGATTATRVNTATGTGSNSRVVSIFDGQLYVSASSSPRLAVQQIGIGTPTTAGQTETTLPGMPTSGTHSTYDFWFRDPSTVYLADDGGAGSGGGIQKWSFDGTNWLLQYTLLNTGTATTAVRGLTGTIDSLGQTVLFATTTATLPAGNRLISVTDTGASALATTLATAAANTAFRGVEYIVPEPASAVLMLLVGVAMAGGTRRRGRT